MTKPIVLLDCDGVLSDFIGGVLDLVHFVTDRKHTHEDVDQFDFCAALKLTTDEARAVKSMIENVGFCAGLKPFPKAVSGVAALESIADVYILTSPWNSNPRWTYEREQWLKDHFGIPCSRVLHGSAKHLIRGDVFVDDRTSAVRQWKESNPDGIAVQWQTLHNRGESWNRASTNDWKVLARIVEQAAEILAAKELRDVG